MVDLQGNAKPQEAITNLCACAKELRGIQYLNPYSVPAPPKSLLRIREPAAASVPAAVACTYTPACTYACTY